MPDASNVLAPLTTSTAISAGLSQLQARIKAVRNAKSYSHVLGAQGGAGESKLTWLPNLRFWVSIEKYEKDVRNRHWLAYGIVDPGTTRKNLDIRVETAIPHRGVNRRIAGLLAKDDAGNTYLLHSGKIGGGKKGFGKTFFWKHYRGDRVLVGFEDGDQEYALIGRIAAPDFPERLADFVHGVDALRRDQLKYTWKFPTGSGLRPVSKKGQRKSDVRLADKPIVQSREHNEVINALRKTLEAHRFVTSVSEDLRDLHIILENGLKLDMEVKTATDRYDIYTAVGQLLLNQDDAELVLVAPRRLEESANLIERLGKLSISVVGYQRSGKSLTFTGLEPLLSKESHSTRKLG